MKRKLAKRVLALLMVPAMCMSLAATASADTWAYKDHSKVADNQPLFIGHRIIDLKNWSPETDPYSDLMRAEVPLQENIDKYERVFGPIRVPDDRPLPPLGNVQGEA